MSHSVWTGVQRRTKICSRAAGNAKGSDIGCVLSIQTARDLQTVSHVLACSLKSLCNSLCICESIMKAHPCIAIKANHCFIAAPLGSGHTFNRVCHFHMGCAQVNKIPNAWKLIIEHKLQTISSTAVAKTYCGSQWKMGFIEASTSSQMQFLKWRHKYRYKRGNC